MYRITSHPILPVPAEDTVSFKFEDKTITGQKGQTIAAALHQAGCPVHSLSLDHRKRTMECGIGKCGACEMLVDGKIRRICITKVDGVREVARLSADSGFKGVLVTEKDGVEEEKEVYRTTVAIIGAGPAGLAVREELLKEGVDCIVIDSNSEIGGQFLMQTHQFFFFEKEKRFGGMRGFDIARTLAGDSHEGIMLDSVVWDILDGKRLAVKNIATDKIFYVDTDELVIATGAVPFMPAFKNDDVPGVYTAAVVQRMMNTQFTLLGKNILTVGAGNIGYLTSYQAMQAGANVRMIIEGIPREGGFPVQANRVRRLGIPILTSHVLVEAVPNADHTGITGAIIAECENFKPIPGTERLIDGIDCINICTGLMPDNQLFVKGNAVFGRSCHGVGDSVRIGEGTSAVLRGRQCAYEILQNLGRRFNYDNYLQVSKEYIDSQQHPVRILQEPAMPSAERAAAAPFVIMDCLYGFACNPCSFACKSGAITKSSTSTTPNIDYDKCIGCMQCVYQCPGLAIFGYDTRAGKLFLPIEYEVQEGSGVFLVDDNGRKVGKGVIEKIMLKPNKTNVARVKVAQLYDGGVLTDARGFIVKERYPAPVEMKPAPSVDGKTYICHCEDLTLERILELIGDRKTISADELKHISRLGMGPCRGKRCLPRAKSALRPYGIEVTGDFTPRAPMASLVELGNVINKAGAEKASYVANKTLRKVYKVFGYRARLILFSRIHYNFIELRKHPHYRICVIVRKQRTVVLTRLCFPALGKHRLATCVSILQIRSSFPLKRQHSVVIEVHVLDALGSERKEHYRAYAYIFGYALLVLQPRILFLYYAERLVYGVFYNVRKKYHVTFSRRKRLSLVRHHSELYVNEIFCPFPAHELKHFEKLSEMQVLLRCNDIQALIKFISIRAVLRRCKVARCI